MGAQSVALIGFMGAGKSSVGFLLAPKLRMVFVDLDEAISAEAKMSVEAIFAAEGEEGFRERESRALKAGLKAGGKVLSCGGGVVLRAANVKLLRGRCRVFLLRISREKVLERLAAADGRPLLHGGELEQTVDRLLQERSKIYLEAAHEVIDADEMSPEEIVEEIAARWLRYRSIRQEGNTPSI